MGKRIGPFILVFSIVILNAIGTGCGGEGAIPPQPLVPTAVETVETTSKTPGPSESIAATATASSLITGSGKPAVEFKFDKERSEIQLIVVSDREAQAVQVKLNIPSGVALGQSSLAGFFSEATHLQSGDEHRWFQLDAKSGTEGSLTLPISIEAGEELVVTLIDVNVKDLSDNPISFDIGFPLSVTVSR